MTSDDDVLRLRDEGLSIRAIADELKLSKSAVHRMLAAADDLDDEDGLEERELALLDGNPGEADAS
jgi:orotate phosphoribosyltransferase-like protein